MSASFKYPIVCECGRTGFECLLEWGHWDACESYSLENFEGGEVTIDKGVVTLTSADGVTTRSGRAAGFNSLTAMRPKCPECGRVGGVRRTASCAQEPPP
jgi:hypothetical protein